MTVKIGEEVIEVTEKMLQNSKAIAGHIPQKPIHDIVRLTKQYGGEAKDWLKMTTRDVFKDASGAQYQIHYYINKVINAIVEAKPKF